MRRRTLAAARSHHENFLDHENVFSFATGGRPPPTLRTPPVSECHTDEVVGRAGTMSLAPNSRRLLWSQKLPVSEDSKGRRPFVWAFLRSATVALRLHCSLFLALSGPAGPRGESVATLLIQKSPIAPDGLRRQIRF